MLTGFHDVVARWFTDRYGTPTDPQALGWPAIRRGEPTLIAAPTGSGKTLTAFLVCIDQLLRDGLDGRLGDELKVLYVSPLKALSHDVRRNLTTPLAELNARAAAEGLRLPELRVTVRTGDTPQKERAAMLKKPPHILVTTPESLYLLLTSARSREIMRTIETVIVDEIHALARDKRGAHLMLSLARLDDLCTKKPQRIGLSATQKPIELVARYLTGAAAAPCAIINAGHRRPLDLGVEVPASELSAVCSNEQWMEVYGQIQDLVKAHRSTLIFVNTRKMAERVAYNLAQILGDEAVSSHHGSLSRERRLDAEERLKHGKLKAIVATASLELGIDVGFVDLVIQVGSPRSIATFLQRIGRSGHAIDATPKGRLLALTRDELLEALALVKAVKDGVLDKIVIPEKPLDVLSQQVVAAATDREWHEDELFAVVKSAYPYRDLTRKEFDDVLAMLSEGFAASTRHRAYLHRDRIAQTLKARDGARIAAVMNGGAIPETGDYRVTTEGDGAFVGTINEDFAIESSAGDVFLLGNTSWQIARITGGEVVVRDANGAPPTIPFWLGEAPGRTPELSGAVSTLRAAIGERVELAGAEHDPLYALDSLSAIRDLNPPAYRPARDWLTAVSGNDWANLQAVHYVAVQKAALGVIPTTEQVVFERFFDETGGMQLVIHAPFGMRINRGWGLALRKRFCRSFDFELQASADNDGIVLSLGPNQSFPIESLFKMLSPDNIKEVLVQAILTVPLFQIRFRWNANRSLAVLRMRNGKRIAPALQRFRADDLMTAVFPQQTQCFEHRTGDLELPDHPLVNQTMHDCLHEAIDLEGLTDVMQRIESGEIQLLARETKEPSPFSYQLLNAYPYAFLDDAPLEERRARAVSQRRTLALGDMSDLARLDPEAIALVAREAWPTARNADELHDVLVRLGVLTEDDGAREARWVEMMQELAGKGRAAYATVRFTDEATVQSFKRFWFATESLPVVRGAYPTAAIDPAVEVPAALARDWTLEDARFAMIRAAMETRGVMTVTALAAALAIPDGAVAATMPALEATGAVIRGRFRGDDLEWCDRRLLMRIHRLTLDGLRKQIKPVSPEAFLHFLLEHQHALPSARYEGKEGLLDCLTQLSGYDAQAGAWEAEILPTRVKDYQPSWLDELMHTGQMTWGRLSPPERDAEDGPVLVGMHRMTPLAMMRREMLDWLAAPPAPDAVNGARSNAQAVYAALSAAGALFYGEIAKRAGLLDAQLDEALGELCRLGLVHADGFAALRPFVAKTKKQAHKARPGLASRFMARQTYAVGGRWALFPPAAAEPVPTRDQRLESWAWLLLHRYGVIFRDLLTREAAAPY